MDSEELAQEKELAFFSAGVEVWFNSALEHDKSIFTLSAGGIGLLITLLTTVGPPSIEILWLYGVAVFCFVVSLIAVLFVFQENKAHIIAVLNSEVDNSARLKFLDRLVFWPFLIGICVTAVIGVSSAISTFESKNKQAKEQSMANKEQGQVSCSVPTFDSVCGLSALTKSFNGMSNLRPPAPTPAPAPAPAQSSQSNGAGNPGTTGSSGGGR